MANGLGYENVPLYSMAALDVLQNSLQTPSRVNRSYDDERTSFAKGQFINITRPARPTVMDAPIAVGSIEDLNVEQVQIELAHYKQIKYKVPDKDLAFAPRFLELHVKPSAYEMANWIDAKVLEQGLYVPHFQDITISSATTAVLTGANKVFAENGVPNDGRRHYAASPAVYQKWLDSSNFSNWQGAGQDGVDTQRTGGIGQKFSFYPYESNNLQSVTAPSAPTVTTGAVVGAHAKGSTSVSLDGVAVSGTFKAGMVIQIGTAAASAGRAYNRQLYAVTADATASSNAVTLQISPPLREAVADNTTWTRKQLRGDNAYVNELAYHANGIALVMAPLPEPVTPTSAVKVITDPSSGLSLRTMVWHDPQLSAHFFSLDCLLGIKLLDPDMCVRGAAA